MMSQGMAADYLKLIEEKTGIVFEIYDKELIGLRKRLTDAELAEKLKTPKK